MVSVGDVFSVKVGKQLGLCHVVAAEKPRGAWDTAGRWRVVTCAWVGARGELAAALTRASSFAPLTLTRLRGQAHVQSIGGAPPSGFSRVASRAPSKASRALRSPKSPGAWQWISTQLEVELEYRADPDAFEAKWAAQVAKQKQARRVEARSVKVLAAPLALGPRRAPPATPEFTAWKTHPRAFVAAVRGVLRALARKAVKAKSVAGVVAALKQATVALERLDAKWGNPVTTPDAEELVEALVDVAVAAGLDAAYAEQVVGDVSA